MAFSKARRLGDLVTNVDGTLLAEENIQLGGDNFSELNVNSTRTTGNIGGVKFRTNGTTKGSIYGTVAGDVTFTVNGEVTEPMRMKADGKVGMGTTVPAARLEVAGSSNSTYFKAGGDDAANARGLTFTSSASANFNGAVHTITAPSSQGAIALKGYNTEGLRVISDGKVGIGTTSPSEELEVNGTVKATAFEGDGSALTNVSGGKLLQVVQTVKTDTWSSSTTTSWVDITGLNVSITPASSSNKVLVNVHISTSNYSLASFRLVRGSTVIAVGDSLGGNRIQATMGALSFQRDGNRVNSASISFLDTPSTTSSTTYKLQAWTYSGTQYINRSYANYNYNYSSSSISTITASEISA